MKHKEKKSKVKLRLELPVEINECLEEIARDLGSTKNDVFRRYLALMNAAHEARKQDLIGVMTKDRKLQKEFIGV